MCQSCQILDIAVNSTESERVRENEGEERRGSNLDGASWEAVKQRHWWYYYYMPLRLVLLVYGRSKCGPGPAESRRSQASCQHLLMQAVMGIGCWQCWVPDLIGSRQKDREGLESWRHLRGSR